MLRWCDDGRNTIQKYKNNKTLSLSCSEGCFSASRKNEWLILFLHRCTVFSSLAGAAWRGCLNYELWTYAAAWLWLHYTKYLKWLVSLSNTPLQDNSSRCSSATCRGALWIALPEVAWSARQLSWPWSGGTLLSPHQRRRDLWRRKNEYWYVLISPR